MNNKIKLNNNCEHCNKPIYLGDGSIIKKKFIHFDCLIEIEREKINKILDDEFKDVEKVNSEKINELFYIFKQRIKQEIGRLK